ncbi:DUF1257 domain-containing protein [Candidatus Borrarchaeum sp.]|uniref:DUF1257 domain-containing protein n=1 Tax=Candidatus Borrarchaeum sp. TaxID=2846742 RepID=UPI002579E332|nr:DUF1257 domain-containing protein [Candidatus Borrarchaeum sp.]
MSHFTTIKTKLTDMDAIKKSLKDLNYNFIEGEVLTRGYGGRKTQAELKITTSRGYDIGLRKSATGEIEIVADWYGIKINRNEFLQKLTQRYSYHKIIAEVKKKGYSVTNETLTENNEIKLTVVRRQWV